MSSAHSPPTKPLLKTTEDIVHLEGIVHRLLQDATVELPIADKDVAQQRMTDLIQELCEKLEDKTILLPLEGPLSAGAAE